MIREHGITVIIITCPLSLITASDHRPLIPDHSIAISLIPLYNRFNNHPRTQFPLYRKGNLIRPRKSTRLNHHDYSQPGHYFVTVCTKDRKDWFGEIKEGKMILNPCGEMARRCWMGIPLHFDGIELDTFIIMPDHVHGIIQIKKNNNVGNRHACSLHDDHSIRRQNQILPVVIGSFKSAVSKTARMNPAFKDFQWQRSFHDHIIRNKQSLQKIREYITQNIEPITNCDTF